MRTSARPELLLSAQALLLAANGEAAAQAADRLQLWVGDHPADAAAWQLLAQAQAARGLPLRALRAEAEARVAVLDYSAAIDRLRAAQNLVQRGTTDHIEASIIDARAHQIASLLREQAAQR
jgi:predicted Zn-dependent protease